MKANDGGPAFPAHDMDAGFAQAGMSLRDYFAAKAMTFFVQQNNPRSCARYSYEFADAMLAERAKG